MEYKWKAFSVTSIGSLMAAVDSTVVILALLPIARDLNSDFVTMVWVVVAYLLASTALVLSLGRISDLYGRKRMYNLGFVVFTVGSALSGFAPDGYALVAFRGLQGVGAAMLTANSFAILSEAFPPRERGKAFGANAILWGVGSTVGIVLGGVIITYVTWRWIFLINLPIGAFATAWAYRTLREVRNPGMKQTFDLPAALIFTCALFSFIYGVTSGLLSSWSSSVTYLSLAASPVFLALFVVWELRYSKSPIIDFSVFQNKAFTFPVLSTLLQSLALFSVNFLLIFYLEGIGGFTVLKASYLLIPTAAASAVVGPIGGILSDRFGPRKIASTGLAIQAGVLLALSRLTVSTPFAYIAVAEAFYGIGGGLFWPSNTSAIMAATQAGKYGVGSGIMNTFRNTGMVLSFALSLTAATSVIPASVAYSLFVGSDTGKLSPQYAASYLTGQSFAFEISAALVVVSFLFAIIRTRSPLPQPPVPIQQPAPVPASA